MSGLARLPRALRHPAAAAGASGPAVDPTNDALPLGSALTAQTAAEPPPWRAHRGGWPRAAASDLDLFGPLRIYNRSYVTTKVSDSASEGCGRAAMHGGQVAAPQPGRAHPPSASNGIKENRVRGQAAKALIIWRVLCHVSSNAGSNAEPVQCRLISHSKLVVGEPWRHSRNPPALVSRTLS